MGGPDPDGPTSRLGSTGSPRFRQPYSTHQHGLGARRIGFGGCGGRLFRRPRVTAFDFKRTLDSVSTRTGAPRASTALSFRPPRQGVQGVSVGRDQQAGPPPFPPAPLKAGNLFRKFGVIEPSQGSVDVSCRLHVCVALGLQIRSRHRRCPSNSLESQVSGPARISRCTSFLKMFGCKLFHLMVAVVLLLTVSQAAEPLHTIDIGFEEGL